MQEDGELTLGRNDNDPVLKSDELLAFTKLPDGHLVPLNSRSAQGTDNALSHVPWHFNK